MDKKPQPKRRLVPHHVLRARVQRVLRDQAVLKRENMALRDPNSFHWAVMHVDLLIAAVMYGPTIPGAADRSNI